MEWVVTPTMTENLTFLTDAIKGYGPYADEATRHATDDRVRAYVGEALAKFRSAIEKQLDAATIAALDAVILLCQFADQAFVVRLQHADLSAETIERLVEIDRRLIELANKVEKISADGIHALIEKIDAEFTARRNVL
jgi:Na+/phosphate symporter